MNFRSSGRKFTPMKILFFILMAILFVAVLGSVVMFLWNALLPELVGAKPINFWQAVGLFVLSRILFGGFRMGSRRHRWKEKRRRWKEKMAGMNEAEKAEFKEKWKSYCDRKKQS